MKKKKSRKPTKKPKKVRKKPTKNLKPFNHIHAIRWIKTLVSVGKTDIGNIFDIIITDRPDIKWTAKSKNALLGIISGVLNPKTKEKIQKEEKAEYIPGTIEGEISFDSDIEIVHPSIDICRLGLMYGVWVPIETNNSDVSVVSDVRFLISGLGVAAHTNLVENDIQLSLNLPTGVRRRVSLELLRNVCGDKKNLVNPIYTTLTTLTREKFAINSKNEMDICDVLGEIYKHYIDFKNNKCYTLFPLWMIGTYIHVIFNTYPYISLYGFEASGKSKTMDLSVLMAFNGQKSVGISSAALYRGTQALRWAMFIDEAGLFKRRRRMSQRLIELMPLILEGYKKGSVVPRVGSKEKGYPLEYFEVFCPKMFADTSELDWVLGSRAIQVVMRPTKRGSEIGNREMDSSDGMWQDVRDALYFFALENWQKIKNIYDNIENEGQLKDREWELFKPMLAIAKFFSEDKYEIILEFAVSIAENRRKEKARERIDYLLIKSIKTVGVFEEWVDVKEIKTSLEEMVGSHDWLNNRWIGRTIKKFNLPCEKRRISRGVEYKFKENEINEIIDRFGLESFFEEAESSEQRKLELTDEEQELIDEEASQLSLDTPKILKERGSK